MPASHTLTVSSLDEIHLILFRIPQITLHLVDSSGNEIPRTWFGIRVFRNPPDLLWKHIFQT